MLGGGVDDDRYPRATQPIVRCALLECDRDCLVSAACVAGAAVVVSWLMMRVDLVKVIRFCRARQLTHIKPPVAKVGVLV
jgi:hypothetical protein